MYAGEGPITTLRNAGIGILANTASSYLTDMLLQKRLENMFTKQTEVGSLVDMLKGRSESDYQDIAPQVEAKLQEHGLFKSGLPKITAEGFRSAGGSPTDRLMSLPEVYSTGAETNQAFDVGTGSKYIQPTETIEGVKARLLSKLSPEDQLKAAFPKVTSISDVLDLMRLQLKQGGQAFEQNYKGQKLGLDQGKFNLAQQGQILEIQKLRELINKNNATNQRLISIEDLSAKKFLDKLTDDMNTYYQKGDYEATQRSMDQIKALGQKYPNLGITPYSLEEPSTIGQKLGINLPKQLDPNWGSPKITGGKTTTAPVGKVTMTPEEAQVELIRQGYTPDGKGGWVKK